MWSVADLCAGVGGFHLVFSRLGIETTMACEIDKNAQKTYLLNFPNTPIEDDITKMTGPQMRSASILCAGFPCQSFSIAGNRLGFEDTRGTIFFDIARLLKEANPPAFFLENVENLSNHDKGRTFKTIRNTLTADLGYHLSNDVLKTRSFGMYQMRSRTIIIGFKNKRHWDKFTLNCELSRPPADFFHLLEGFEKVSAKYFIKNDSWMATKNLHKIENPENPDYIYQFRRKYWREYPDRCPTLTANMGTGGHNVPFIFDSRGEPPEGYTSYRKLTPLETFRLQGFDTPGFPFALPNGLADSKLYKQAGNSIPLNLIFAVAQNIMKAIE